MRSRTRVLHVLKTFRPDFTGEGIFFERCSALMSALDPAVEHHLLVTLTPRPRAPAPIGGTVPRLVYLSRAPLPSWRHEGLLVWWFLRNLHRYRVVHAHTHVDWYFLTYLMAKLAGRRLVLSATLDDSIPGLVGLYRPSLRRLARRMFGVFDAFISSSPKLHRETSAVMPAGRCHLIECGILFPRSDRARGRGLRARLGVPADALVLIFVGGLCDRKDPLLLVRNHRAILEHFPDCWLWLVGPPLEPGYVAEMRRLARASGAGHRIVFLGEATNPHRYFEAADIMTFASRLEGFGMVVPEAMGHGLPAVVRALPGVNDGFVRAGETGFLFDDDASYRAAVLRLAGDPVLRHAMGARGQALVRRKYDAGRVARRYLAAYGGASPPGDPEASPVPETLADIAGPLRRASIVDRRFHTPVRSAPDTPRLIVLADAEEAFDWSRPFSRGATDVTSMAHQEPAHRIYERYGIVPTYLADYPVVAQEAGRRVLRDLLRDRRCDVGAQLHPWVTPPFEEEVSVWTSYQANLPLALEQAKLQRLVEAIGTACDRAPRIFRAGRYGAGLRTAELLLRMGFEADSSVMPCWDYSRTGGPDYLGAPAQPHWLDTGHTLLEIPVSAAVTGRLCRRMPGLGRALFRPLGERLGLPGVARRLGMGERIRLSPEGSDPAEAKRLIRAMLAGGQRTFVVSYHTPSLQPGNTPYVRSAGDLRRFLTWLDEVLDFFRSDVGGTFATWRDVREAALADGTPATGSGSLRDGGGSGPPSWRERPGR